MGTNAESVKVVRRSGYRKSFSVSIRFDNFRRRWPGTLFSTWLGISGISLGDSPLSVFLPLSFSLLSFSTSSRGRRSTIDDDTRIRPGSSTDRSTERPGESVKTDEAVAMRPFYTDPHLHLLSYFFVVLLLVVVVVLFLRLFAPYLPTYLPTYLLFSTWLDRVFSPFLRRARAHCTHEQFTTVIVSENFCIHLQKKRERKREGHIALCLNFLLVCFPPTPTFHKIHSYIWYLIFYSFT